MWSLRHPSLLFLLNRLNTLVMCACFILRPFSPENILSCRAYESLGNLFSLACLLLWSSLSSLRVYAVSNRNLWVTIVNAVLGLVPFCVNLYGMTQESLQLWNLDSFNLCYAVSTSVTATIFNRRVVPSRRMR
ncbi:uncharacterized protein B0H18DRAFT_1051722 [Fomitopsis serialis]|uniref:uncharacterized protein n=1 Tax=Fomitopsis serialis TaxID=139415 RepID=UPI002008BECF|nr:uncharacterized protein B0H18DRAFT_1051722 [Neoantrodia serialis]KAH9912839.1 hypothetical protein B0H18DRAFT_1051722 [Neoantrodia serialis]